MYVQQNKLILIDIALTLMDYILIHTSDSAHFSLESFTGVTGDVGAHAKADYVYVIIALRRVFRHRRYHFTYIVSDFFAPHPSSKVRKIQRKHAPVHAHHIVIVQREIF